MGSDSVQPLRDQIADRLREQIIDGALAPGQRVREDEVASFYGVSRVPVREAVQKLAAEGFLDLAQFRGAVVPTPTRRRLLELIQVRQALEAMAARLAAERRGGERAERLAELADAGTSAVGAEDYAAVPDLVEEFHECVAEASGNAELAAILGLVRDKIRWIFAHNLPGRSHQEWRDHTRIVDAILAGDGGKAARLMAHHVSRDEMLCRTLPFEDGRSPAKPRHTRRTHGE